MNTAELARQEAVVEGLPEGPGKRLHLWSLVFELFAELRGMAGWVFPLLLGSFSDRFGSYALYGMAVAAAFVVVSSIGKVWLFRYWVTDAQLVLRSGWLQKTVRRIPWTRIENLTVTRGPAHRLLGVAEVTIESGGGDEVEAAMRVLSRRDALALQSALGERRGGVSAGGQVEAAGEREHSQTLLKLGAGELLRAGLISNRGFLAIAAAFALASQLDDVLPFWDWITAQPRALAQGIGLEHGLVFWAALVVFIVAIGFALMRLLSVIWWLLIYWNFRLSLEGDKLRSDYGALTRVHASATRDRVSKLLIADGLGHRLMNRVAIKVGVAGQRESQTEHSALIWVAPVLALDRVNVLVQAVFPGCERAGLSWQPLHPSCRLRVFRLELLWLFLLIPVALKFGAWSLLLVPVVCVAAHLTARSYQRYSAYAFDGRFLAFRSGIIDRDEWLVPVDRIESVELRRSPGDRRHGTARLLLDLRSAGPGERCEIRYLDMNEAQALALELRAKISGSGHRRS
ncbi:MAG: PH domain-containing protein [Lysobacterales bacterium]